MNSMSRQLNYLESRFYIYQGQRMRHTFYPWKSPHKLEPDCVSSSGPNAEMISIFDLEFDSFDWWREMKARLETKTAFQKKLDFLLFEAVGNGNRSVERFGTPDLDHIKELVALGATVDHFLHADPLHDQQMEEQYESPRYSFSYKNAIDNAMGNLTLEGFETAKYLILTFPDYRHSFLRISREDHAPSLFQNACYEYHVNLAVFVISLGKEKHPFCAFMPNAFQEDNYCTSGPIYPVTPEQAAIDAFDFEEKVLILDAIRENYDFEEKFKEDYRIMKEFNNISPGSPCVEHMLCIRNLKILNQYARLRGMSPESLYGELEYEWLKTEIPDFDIEVQQT